MKKIKIVILSMLAMNSANSFAGVGSTLDVVLTAQLGFNYGCSEVNTGPADKLRVTACQLGASMRKAGITPAQFNKVINVASENMTEFKSICQ